MPGVPLNVTADRSGHLWSEVPRELGPGAADSAGSKSEREKQIPDANTYIWNLKNNFFFKWF